MVMERVLTFLSQTGIWFVGLALAAFLVLFWALRGAPIGQAAREEADDDAPAAGYRDRVIAAMVGGLLLIVSGAYVALSGRVVWSLPVFAAGFAIVLMLMAANRRHRHASPALRRTLEFSDAALNAALVAGVLVVVNVLAFRYGGKAIDFTREKAFSLSSLTLNQVASLDRPVTFTVLFGEGPLAAPHRNRVIELLDLYKAANPQKVGVEYVNPFVEIDKVEALTKRVPNIPIPQDGGILIDYGEGDSAQHVMVRNLDMFDVPRRNQPAAGPASFRTDFRGEDAVTSALIGLREQKKPQIAFTTGHGEPSINDLDPRRPGIGILRARLDAIGSDAVEFSPLSQEVPSGAALVVIAGPKTAFKPEEVARLRRYTDRGGPVLLLLGSGGAMGLEEFLRSYNVEIGKGVIVDPPRQFQGRPGMVFVPVLSATRHPVVDPLADRYVLMPNAAPLKVLGTPGAPAAANQNLLPTAILRTAPDAWAEVDRQVHRDPGTDEIGPLTVGVAVADRPRPGADTKGTPRLVILSSGLMADNPFLEIEPTNLDLLINAASWLRGKAELRGIAPKTHEALTLVANPGLRTRLILVPTVMAVLLIISLGVATYASRRE
jgi:hypothetical protein